MAYIYKITNNINQMIYVGLTTKKRPTDRFSQHRYIARHPGRQEDTKHSYLYPAMRKYGLENFSFEIIEECSPEELDERERYWIVKLNSKAPNGYNLTDGGRAGVSGFSRPQTVEERLKRQQANKQYYLEHPEAREQIRERTKELWKNPEYREKVTLSNQKFYQEHPDKFKGENNPMYGKKHTEEALEKIRAHAATRKTKIVQLDKDTLEEIQIFDGIKDAEKALGVSHGWLSKAAKADKIAYGFRWKFI